MNMKKWLTYIVTIIVAFSMMTGSALATDTISAETTQPKKNGWDSTRTHYYVDDVMVKGYYRISDSQPYFFDKRTGKVANKGFIKDGGKEYYCKGNGKLATGWMAIKYKSSKKKVIKRGFYFYEAGNMAGYMAKNTTIGHLKIPKNGRLHEAYFHGIKTLNKKGWTLKAAYNQSKRIKYHDQSFRLSKKIKKNKSERYALKGFKEKKGNCFVINGSFYIMAKLLGYDARQVVGKVKVTHSWVEIKQNGKIFVYDPECEAASKYDRKCYKIHYGKKGTLKYKKTGKFNNFVKAK